MQAITIDVPVFARYRGSSDFIREYVFPGGMLALESRMVADAAEADLRLEHSSRFGHDYATTLKLWRERVQTAAPSIRARGFDERFMRLWTDQQGFRDHAPYALDLEYALDTKATALVATSIAEMRKQGHRDEAVLARWSQAMAVVFPDVRKGDRLIGLAHPDVAARFYSAQGYIASIRDPAFVEAFFGIWLNAATSAPTVRARLLEARP